ncbi:hypothetical protein HPP92_016246 [Vanilla planifolia]|uniref:BHLH domain-containing protein n=1 Tax=Vanilla planifolia TaxID=51239 RepID=A0A835UT61_VANPL|nr:hypothetical protein HPP92_016854 [Vanilla planifolia]KAG0471700.1 hypothetical protein HPP92_016246 [Vanilla planifolia]
MSSRRSRQRQSTTRIADEQIDELLSKLQALLPEARQRSHDRLNNASAARVLQETCNYIRGLHDEVDGLSERLSELLAATDDRAQAAIISSLLK